MARLCLRQGRPGDGYRSHTVNGTGRSGPECYVRKDMSAAFRWLVLACFVLVSVATARASWTDGSGQSSSRTAAFPDHPGRDVVVRICMDCHASSDITRRRESRFRWSVVVDSMVGEGAKINEKDFETAVVYLSVAFGKQVRINAASASVVAETFDIAPEDADKIVKVRNERGPFKSWQEIAAIPGIDAKRVEEQRSNLDFTAGLRLVLQAPAAQASSRAASAPHQ